MNFDFVLRRNSQGWYINHLRIINNARPLNTKCIMQWREMLFLAGMDFVKQRLKYSEDEHFLNFGWWPIFLRFTPEVDISTSRYLEKKKHLINICSDFSWAKQLKF